MAKIYVYKCLVDGAEKNFSMPQGIVPCPTCGLPMTYESPRKGKFQNRIRKEKRKEDPQNENNG